MSPKILTIDDSKTIRMIVAKAFKPFDCVVFEAENGLTGLNVASQQRPDLIILDYTMPVMDGFETLSKLRIDPDLKGTPVIMLTAEAGRDTVVKMAKLAIRDYLIKPFKEEALIERVTKVVPLRAKAEGVAAVRRYDDPIQVLVLDDKPAIVDQVRAALADTKWVVHGVADSAAALERCNNGSADIVLASLSLPQDGAFVFLKTLKSNPRTRALPALGLSLKTAAADQARGQQEGFVGAVTKPIDPAELKTRICRTLKLETSYRYFQQRNSALCVKLPKEITSQVSHEVNSALSQQLANAVDSGNAKFVIDLVDVDQPSMALIELTLGAAQAAREIGLQTVVMSSEPFRAECAKFEETQTLNFAATFEDALALVA